MEALFLLIPLALIFCALAVKAFFWAVGNRQFDNLDSAARSILFDDEGEQCDSKPSPQLHGTVDNSNSNGHGNGN